MKELIIFFYSNCKRRKRRKHKDGDGIKIKTSVFFKFTKSNLLFSKKEEDEYSFI